MYTNVKSAKSAKSAKQIFKTPEDEPGTGERDNIEMAKKDEIIFRLTTSEANSLIANGRSQTVIPFGRDFGGHCSPNAGSVYILTRHR